MPRADLLALTPDDLAAITNRGTVKRAQREIEEGAPTADFAESPEGELVVNWSDGIRCRFPAGKSMHDARCSSGIEGISRHVVRSVLAYQKHCRASQPAAQAPPDSPGEPNVVQTSSSTAQTEWDPGEFTDEQLIDCFRKASVAKARQRFERGVLVELTRGEKPVARFLDEPHTLRFLVRGDLRYITADCAEPLLATFVPLAVWAFRMLPPERKAGLVAVQSAELPTPTDVLGSLESLLLELFCDGIAGCNATWPQRLQRLESQLRDAGLVWPAELAADLHRQYELYRTHDARFDPLEVAHLAGELTARGRAIESGNKVVPQLLIRGTSSDRVTEIAGGRLIGLGLDVKLGRRVTTLSAFLQDADTGSLVAVERTFADPPEESGQLPKSFAELAQMHVARGISLGNLGTSQLLLKSGKRTPSGRLVLPRTASSLTANPQSFQWEHLRPPAAVENFTQLAARLEVLPPSYLRPRRLTENLHVCAVSRVEDVGFNERTQQLLAVLRDGSGERATMVHSFHSRGQAGFEALATALRDSADRVRFVCGRVTRMARDIVIRPVCVVIDHESSRVGLQPWIGQVSSSSSTADLGDHTGTDAASPIDSFLQQLQFELSELLLSGLRSGQRHSARSWSELTSAATGLGFVRLVEPLEQLTELLRRQADVVRWDPTPAARVAMFVCLCSRVSSDVAARVLA